MREDNIVPPGRGAPSYAELLREIGSSTRDLVESEVRLVSAELKDSAHIASRHVTQAVIFGALLAISVLPFLAFLVIGLGELMGGQYWLSSLIIAVACAVIGGIFAYRAYRKLTQEDLQLPRTKRSLVSEAEMMKEKSNDLRTAAKGERYDETHLH